MQHLDFRRQDIQRVEIPNGTSKLGVLEWVHQNQHRTTNVGPFQRNVISQIFFEVLMFFENARPSFFLPHPLYEGEMFLRKCQIILEIILRVCTLGALYRQVGLHGVFVKIGDFAKFKGFLVEFLENRCSSDNQKIPENHRKSGLF